MAKRRGGGHRRCSLKPFGGVDGERVRAHGVPVRLGAEAAVALQLGLHELATNAAKYGAFSRPEGRVVIDWQVDPMADPPRFSFSWRERGGPPAAMPERRGVGSRLIERGMPYAMGGEARLDFAPEGVNLVLSAPLSDRVTLA